MKKVLIIVGSLRKGSFNRQMAGIIEGIIGNRAEVSYLEYADIPYMNQDIEFPAPKEIARVRKAVSEANGIWICTPEYNFNIPGVLKNLLDWLSRPLVENDWSSGSAAAGKPVTVSGAGGKNATRNVRALMNGLLTMMKMDVVGGDGTGISLNGDAFTTGKAVFSETDIKTLEKQADEFISRLG